VSRLIRLQSHRFGLGCGGPPACEGELTGAVTDTAARADHGGCPCGVCWWRWWARHISVWPDLFAPINLLAFGRHDRTFSYVNGAIETIIGAAWPTPGLAA
jgi:hypothetical protein